MVRQHDTHSPDLEKSPSLDFESSFPFVDISLQDGVEDTNRQDIDRPPSIRPLSYRSGSVATDHESEWRAWLCVFGSFLFLVCSTGFNGSIGTIQSYFSDNQLKNNTNSQIGWILGIHLFLACAPSFLYGSLLDRYGPRLLSAVGGILSAATFLIMGQCKAYWEFMFCFGVFGSIGTGINCTVAIGVVGKLFVRRRGLAMGIAVTGASLGATIFPLVLHSTFEHLGWVWSMRIVAIVIASSTSVGFLCFLPFERALLGSDNYDPYGTKDSPFNLSAWKDNSFFFVAFSLFFMEFVNCGIAGLLPAISTSAGFTAKDGFILLSIIGGTSCISRLFMGVGSDRIGGMNAMVITMILMVIMMSTIFLPFTTARRPFFYAFAVFWGLLSGSFYTVAPICVGKTCAAKDYARYYGSTNLLVGVSLLVANPVSSVMLDKVGAKALAFLYLGVTLAALASMVVARGLVVGNFLVLKTKV